MKKITIILSFFVVVLNAQQYSLPTQLDRNLLYINPAYAGSLEATVASLMHRSQWINMPGAVAFQNFEFHAPLKKQAVAIGVQARHETIGSKDNSEVFLSYAHRIRMQKSTLAFALKAGGQSISYGKSILQNKEVADAAFTNTSTIIPNAGFGLSFYNKSYFVGLSIPYFFGSQSTSDGNTQIDFDIDRLAYIFSAGGSIPINSSLSMEPVGALYYSKTLKPQVTAILNFKWLNSVLLGAGYRLNEGIIFNTGYFLSQQFSIAYSYDYNIGKIGAYSSGSHELGLLYYFGFKVNTISPRDF